MPYQVSMMGWVGSGEDFCGLGWVGSRNFGLGFEKVTHDQLWAQRCLALTSPVFPAYVITYRPHSVLTIGNNQIIFRMLDTD